MKESLGVISRCLIDSQLPPVEFPSSLPLKSPCIHFFPAYTLLFLELGSGEGVYRLSSPMLYNLHRVFPMIHKCLSRDKYTDGLNNP